MDQSIIPECFVDTNLIETLVPPHDKYNHQKGCGTVTSVMKKKFADRFAVGIIDKDKREVDYLKEFVEVCRNNNGALILHKHRSRHHFIIQISPAIERFLLSITEAAGISLSDFDLPANLDDIKKLSKTVNSKNDLRFKKLFKSLNASNVPEIRLLTAWITYLKEQNYNADIEVLKNL